MVLDKLYIKLVIKFYYKNNRYGLIIYFLFFFKVFFL